MPPNLPAFIYALLSASPIAMHIALASGAPLGRFTLGGRFPGHLPWPWRGLALVQASLLVGMAAAILSDAGVLTLGWPPSAFWAAFTLTGLSLLANAASPSRPERLLWTPLLALMSLCALASHIA